MAKFKTFTICAKLMLDTTAEVSAESLEQAVEKSRTFTVDDFVEILGEHNDSSLTIYGVFGETP